MSVIGRDELEIGRLEALGLVNGMDAQTFDRFVTLVGRRMDARNDQLAGAVSVADELDAAAARMEDQAGWTPAINPSDLRALAARLRDDGPTA